VRTEILKIYGTLHTNFGVFELLMPAPQKISSVAWCTVKDTYYFYVRNFRGRATYIYLHGEFLVDFSTAGEEREISYIIDDEKGEAVEIKTTLDTYSVIG